MNERNDDDTELAEAAAWNALAAGEGASDEASPPGHLKKKLAADAERFFDKQAGSVTDIATARPQPPLANMSRILGWAVAATLAIALIMTSRNDIDVDPVEPDLATARALLIETVPDTQVVRWSQPEIAEYAMVRGDVAWNDALQEGYLRLVGMPANDPSESQYQLWIVDSDRDANPVDGGVFDIPAAGGEAIIPINAKLAVSDPEAFAITREKPGGVVVSAGPLLIVAAAG